MKINELSDDQLVAETRRLARDERTATAALIRRLAEVDARRLYLREGCPSLFVWCTQMLHLSEAAAFNRIEVARLGRRFPVVFDALDEGGVTLTAVKLLGPYLMCREPIAAGRAARGSFRNGVAWHRFRAARPLNLRPGFLEAPCPEMSAWTAQRAVGPSPLTAAAT